MEWYVNALPGEGAVADTCVAVARVKECISPEPPNVSALQT